jgi:hypothetical protein
MKRASNRIRDRRAAAVLMAFAITGFSGCVGASPSASHSAPPGLSAAPSSSPSPSPSLPTLSFIYPRAAETKFTWIEPAATPAPSVPATPTIRTLLPDVPAAPSGDWTSIQWTSLGLLDDWGLAPAPTSGPTPYYHTAPTFHVFGWSHGYVGFTTYPALKIYAQPTASNAIWDGNDTVVSSYSSDGVHWHKGHTLDVASDDLHWLESVHAVIEGAGGLLAVGWSGGCASLWVEGLWTSVDGGVSWQPVDARAAFGHALLHSVSGGPAGYVAVAYHGRGVWTSKDGRTWQAVAMDAAPFVDSKVDDGTAFSGGFVLAGTSGVRDCSGSTYTTPAPGATPSPTPVPVTNAVWWSADSAGWTRTTLPGSPQRIWLCRVSDRTVLVVGRFSDDGNSVWASIDGQNWTPTEVPADFDQYQLLTNGQRGVVVRLKDGPASVSFFDSNLRLDKLPQNGDVPQVGSALTQLDTDDGSGYAAVGPTGVVVTDGRQSWIGIPSEG